MSYQKHDFEGVSFAQPDQHAHAPSEGLKQTCSLKVPDQPIVPTLEELNR